MLIIALIVFNVQYHYFFLLHSVNLFLAFGVVLISSLAAALLVLSEVMPELFKDELCEVSVSTSSSGLLPSALLLFCSWGLSEVIKDDFKDEAASLKLLWKLISCDVQGGDSEIKQTSGMSRNSRSRPIRGQRSDHLICPDH